MLFCSKTGGKNWGRSDNRGRDRGIDWGTDWDRDYVWRYIWGRVGILLCPAVCYEYLSRYIYEAKARGRTIILSTKGDQGIYGERRKSEGARLDRRRVAKVNY